MNRENKRKTFEKGYYKTHPCRDSFVCKVCGRLCTPENAGSDRRRRRLILTEKADPVISDGKKMQKYFTETLKKNITPEEMAAFQSLTDKLNSNIALFGKKDQSQCLK